MVSMENDPQRASDKVIDYPEDLPLVHTDPHTDPFPKQKDESNSPPSRTRSLVIGAVILVAVLSVFIGILMISGKPSAPATSASKNLDVCANTHVAVKERSALVYTDQRYIQDDALVTSKTGAITPWCVFTTTYDSGLYWGAVYVGSANPLYTTLTAENGEGDSSTRGVITYQSVPPIKFAKGGWIAFITPSEEKWTADAAVTSAKRLADIAQQAAAPKTLHR